jgi:hypothetical protein
MSISDVAKGSVKLHGEVNPGFEETEYAFEYGTSPCSSNQCTEVSGSDTLNGLKFVQVEQVVSNLEPGQKYYYRLVATNAFGTDVGSERTFTSFPNIDLTEDPCANALARKQTRTADLLDCRAYELASADFTGGYDVVSDLAPGQVPYDGFPGATDKVVYSVRDGGIPGTGSPTNRGPDPYLATRTEDGWTTKYVGVPSDGTPSPNPFSSTLLDADDGLSSFAFGGPDICNPCFTDGSAGIPVRLPDGSLTQGMTGSMPHPGVESEGYIGNPMSANGDHLVFGSGSQFEPAGNSSGDVTVYDRDLSAGTTQVASTLPDGSTMTGPGIGELDISADGSRIVVGRKVATDPSGNSHWQLYMHIGATPQSVDLTPGTSSGVLYLGMSNDGARVFFSTEDKLNGGDTDTSADIYEVEVSGVGAATPELVSVAPGGPSDACEPAGAPNTWNAVAGDGTCSAVGLAGGAGVAADGTIYFLSPELLAGAGHGEADEANLFVVRPGGSPEFVATLDSSAGTTPPPPLHPVVNGALIEGLSQPGSLAVDQQNGDIYVAEVGTESVKRFNAAGAPSNFTEGPSAGSNAITGQEWFTPFFAEVAVDNAAGSPLKGSLYVTSAFGGIKVFSGGGEPLGQLTGLGFITCGVAVEQSTGVVYAAAWGEEGAPDRIWRFAPTSPPGPGVSSANYSVTSLLTESPSQSGHFCQLAAGDGQVYASAFFSGPIRAFEASEFAASPALREGVDVSAPGSVPPVSTMYVDPSTNELYVDTGSQIVIFDDEHDKVTSFGSGNVSPFGGVAVNGGEGAGQSSRAHHAYAVNGENIVEFGLEPDVYQPIDDPAILHAVDDNEVHRWSDFQTSATGRFALLSSEQPLAPGYDNGGLRMVHRYDAGEGELSCVSCLSSEAVPNADSDLPTHGLGITEDGRAFFNSDDQLVLRDQNGKKDAYEWNNGSVSLISTGFSSAPSSLLTVTNDGKDAFFFTRESLVDRDRNGQAMKLYDAREGGGIFVLPPSPPCAASDECHGPSSLAAPPPPIGTFRGTGGQHVSSKCKKGFVKKRGKCVRKRKKHRKHRKHRKHKGTTAKNHAGGSR